MTSQEQQLLNGLIERVNGTQLTNKDGEAESLLNTALRNNPDALYILCQTVLVQQFAMENAQRQLTEARGEVDRLKQQAAKPQEHGSFLGNLFGLGKSDDDRPQSPTSPPTTTAPAQQGSGYAPVHNPAPQYGYPPSPPVPQGYGYGQPQGYGYGQPGYGAGMPMGGGMFGGGGGFLQGAMQTAAGVVAGEFAFRAIEDVFHGFGGGGGGRGFEGGNEIVNNYYNDSGDRDNGGGFGDRLRDADGLGSGISPDIEDRRGESQGFFGSADDTGNDAADFGRDDSSDVGSFNDDAGFDNGSNDDSGF